MWSVTRIIILVIAVCSLVGLGLQTVKSQDDSQVFLPLTGYSNDDFRLPDRFDVEGHRGARGLKPENTLPSFEQALDLGVTTLELDLHFSVDQIVVVWHDDTITPDKCRLPDSLEDAPPDPDDPQTPQDDLRISNLTAAQLAQYRCDRNPNPTLFPQQENGATALAADNYGIPTLEDVFAFVDEYSRSDLKTPEQQQNAEIVQFNIETKRKPDDPDAIGDDFDGLNPGPFEIAIIDLVETRNLEDRVILQSFDHRSLWAAHTLNQTVRLAALTVGGQDLGDYADKGASIWSPNYQDVTSALLAEAHARNLQVIPWTVNNPDDMRRLIDLGVDGIISDRPDILLALGD